MLERSSQVFDSDSKCECALKQTNKKIMELSTFKFSNYLKATKQ